MWHLLGSARRDFGISGKTHLKRKEVAMSASGHLQTYLAQDGMSASPAKTDIATTTRNVGYGP